MFPYDATLLAAVQSSPRSVADVVATFQSIQAVCTDADGLKWFNGLYLQVTLAVEARVNSARFQDAAWIAVLDVQFAGLYFSAIRSYLSNAPTPGCWQALFDRRNQAAIARIQFAFAGMNAHINHDLPLAIVNTARATGALPQHGDPHYADYTSLNATLDTLIEAAKQTLNVRLLGDALPPVSHLEDTLAAWSVAAARETAWNNAELLLHLEPTPLLSSAFVDSLDGFTALAGKALLVPVP
jgi:hypothetical protein